MNKLKLLDHINEFKLTMVGHYQAIRFARTHKIWLGFWKYGWVSRLLVGLAIIISIKSIYILRNWFASESDESTSLVEVGSLIQTFATESYSFLFSGLMKYLMLIMLEVIIFHMCRITFKILSGKDSNLSMDLFIKAQIRMIKVAFRAFVLEMFISLLISIIFGIFSRIDFLEPIFIYSIQCYFLGVIVMDNYFEQFNISIKQSFRIINTYLGVAMGVGLVLNIVLLIPIFGTIIGPALAAITSTLILYKITDFHLMDVPKFPIPNA